MSEPLLIPSLDIEGIVARRKHQWMKNAKAEMPIQDRVALSVPWWLIIIFAGLFALSAGHTIGVFSELSPIGYAGPFVVEFALLWAAFLRVTANQRVSVIMRILEVLAFGMALIANGVGAMARVATLAGIDKLSADAILHAYGGLPITTQAFILTVPIFALFVPIGTWAAGEGIATLFIKNRKGGGILETAWRDVQVGQVAQAIYAELINRTDLATAKKLSMSMSAGYFNAVRQPVRQVASVASDVKALPEPAQVSAVHSRTPVRRLMRPGKTAPNRDARQIVRDYLDGHPDALDLSARQLASVAGVSKTIANEVQIERKKETQR